MKLVLYSLAAVNVITVVLLWATLARGHDGYHGWASKKTGNCCNERDCSDVPDKEWRETDHGAELLIEGKWCPVLQEHFIIYGKSPNAEVAHACIRNRKDIPAGMDPCERLLCFVGPFKS
jgi:hypothetical protein